MAITTTPVLISDMATTADNYLAMTLVRIGTLGHLICIAAVFRKKIFSSHPI